MLAADARGANVLLIAPTGGGKTLAGFLPSLVALAARRAKPALHTLYISPLKALAADIARNLAAPVQDMALPITIATRTGDTTSTARRKQRVTPPDILLTTPESLALLLSDPDAGEMFAGLARIVVDEIHALAGTKRGDQLALCLARLAQLAPQARRIGLSATIAHPAAIAAYIGVGRAVDTIEVAETARPEISLVLPSEDLAWGGRTGLAGAPAVLGLIGRARLSIVFVNTRAQAELLFQALWRLNDDNLPIALHHGSLDSSQRDQVEAAMADGRLRAVIATASLDLGIDWGAVDQVIQLGAPKGVSRLLQRVGRANHRMNEPSVAALVPANRFEALECQAAIEAIAAGARDGDPPRPGGLDVLAQHILLMACSAPFLPDELFDEIRSAAPYASLSRTDFDDVVRFVTDGGYALAAYDRYRRLFGDSQGRLNIATEKAARQARMNIGTIVEQPMLKVRLRRGALLGEVEENFGVSLRPGDGFVFAGRHLRFLILRETVLECEEGVNATVVPIFAGQRMPLSTHLSAEVRAMLHDPLRWQAFPDPVRQWLTLQQTRSVLPAPDEVLIEIFPRQNRYYLVAYCFEGRNAHQTLGMLLTRRLARQGAEPLGFVATDYVLGVWCVHKPSNIEDLFAPDMLGDDLDAWMAETSMLKRAFRQVSVIAGLIDRRQPGAGKNRRQVTINSDLIYAALRRHQPNHVLLRATLADAATGLIDLGRLGDMLTRTVGKLRIMQLARVSPLAVPVLLDIGRESVRSEDTEDAALLEAELLADLAVG